VWNEIIEDNEIKKIIQLDIVRTFQEFEIFRKAVTQRILSNILFVWAKGNKEVSYRQGMNEIIGILFLAMMPYYVDYNKYSKSNLSVVEVIEKCIEVDGKCDSFILNNTNLQEIYIFLFDESEIESDLYFLFDALMSRGIANLYKQTEEATHLNDQVVNNKVR
jgi:hypothetical protein